MLTVTVSGPTGSGKSVLIAVLVAALKRLPLYAGRIETEKHIDPILEDLTKQGTPTRLGSRDVKFVEVVTEKVDWPRIVVVDSSGTGVWDAFKMPRGKAIVDLVEHAQLALRCIPGSNDYAILQDKDNQAIGGQTRSLGETDVVNVIGADEAARLMSLYERKG